MAQPTGAVRPWTHEIDTRMNRWSKNGVLGHVFEPLQRAKNALNTFRNLLGQGPSKKLLIVFLFWVMYFDNSIAS